MINIISIGSAKSPKLSVRETKIAKNSLCNLKVVSFPKDVATAMAMLAVLCSYIAVVPAIQQSCTQRAGSSFLGTSNPLP